VFAAGILYAFILLTGCHSNKPQYSNHNLVGPARAGVNQTGTVTLTNELDRRLLEPPTRMFTLGQEIGSNWN